MNLAKVSLASRYTYCPDLRAWSNSTTSSHQLPLKNFTVSFGCNHHKPFACLEAFGDEMRNSFGEKRVAFVELEAMPRLGRIARRWVGQGLRAHLRCILVGTHSSLGVIAKNIVYNALD